MVAIAIQRDNKKTKMAASMLAPIRMAKIPSTASSLSETRSRIHEKVYNSKSKEIADPLKVLEPERKKLTSLESQRVLAVLEDSIRRIEISTILPFVVENLNRFSIVLGAELTHLLKEHDSLQGRYQKAVSHMHLEERRLVSLQEKFAQQKKKKEAEFFPEDEGSSVDMKDGITTLDVTLAEGKAKKERKMVNSLHEQLKQSLKNLLRHFVRNPTAMDSLRSESKERSEEANEMLVQLSALKGTLFERLLRTPSELKERDTYLKFITERERKLSKHAKKLREELNVATEDKENEASICPYDTPFPTWYSLSLPLLPLFLLQSTPSQMAPPSLSHMVALFLLHGTPSQMIPLSL